MNFDTPLALFQHLLAIDEDNMAVNLPTLISNKHEFYTEVTALITAHVENKKQTSFNLLIGKQAEQLVDNNIIHDLINTQVGVYKLTQKLGQGGMGSVYLGERNDGLLEQKVAVKFVYPSIISLVGDDFLQIEAQHLANLEHSNITKVLTIDKTENDLPYMVMEYVVGTNIVEYCEQKNLNLNARIKLFQKVCSSIQFAHQNMVIHADIKPSNILINEQGEPKLMDFGIARVADHTDFTNSPINAASHYYSSPEQLLGKSLTTKSDIYSIGKLLDTLINSVAIPPLKTEIKSIIHKASNKKEKLRYQSISELIHDLSLFTRGYPIRIYSSHWFYRFKKFILRNQVSSILATTLLVSVLAMSASVYLQNNALKKQITTNKEVTRFLTDLFDASNVNKNATLTVKDILDIGRQRITDEFSDSPLVKARLEHKMALAYFGQREFVYAEQLFLRAISFFEQQKNQRDLINSYNALGLLYSHSGEHKKSDFFLNLALQHKDKNTTQLNISYVNLGDLYYRKGKYKASIEYSEKALDGLLKIDYDNYTKLASISNNIGAAHHGLGNFEKALTSYKIALQYTEALHGNIDHPKIAMRLLNIGTIYSELQNHAKATELLLKSLAMFKTLAPQGHPREGIVLNNLGSLFLKQENYQLALEYFQESLLKMQLIYGNEHFEIAVRQHNIASAKRGLGDLNEAIQEHEKALEILNKKNIKGTVLAIMQTNYAQTLVSQKRYQVAKPLIDSAYNIFNSINSVHPRFKLLKNLKSEVEKNTS